MTTWIFTALDGRAWRADGETAFDAYRDLLLCHKEIPRWSNLDRWEAEEPEPEQAPTEPPPPIEPSREDAVVDEFDRAVGEARRLATEHRDAVLVALDAAAGVFAYSVESQREWLRERAALLEENARLRNVVKQWSCEQDADEIAMGYDADEEVEEP